MSIEITLGNTTLVKLINDVARTLEELAAWPDSQINQEAADRAIKLLRKGWKDQSYPRAFLFFSMLHIAHNVFGDTLNRGAKGDGLKAAWMKLGELL